MSVKRIVPNVVSDQPEASRDFYAGFLGLDVAMDMGWVATYASPLNPTAQITVLAPSRDGAPTPAVSVEVADVDAAYKDAIARGYAIVYPLTDEPWGVRRFFVADPNGVIINVLSHARPGEAHG